jgi:hypothetical protein
MKLDCLDLMSTLQRLLTVVGWRAARIVLVLSSGVVLVGGLASAPLLVKRWNRKSSAVPSGQGIQSTRSGPIICTRPPPLNINLADCSARPASAELCSTWRAEYELALQDAKKCTQDSDCSTDHRLIAGPEPTWIGAPVLNPERVSRNLEELAKTYVTGCVQGCLDAWRVTSTPLCDHGLCSPSSAED